MDKKNTDQNTCRNTEPERSELEHQVDLCLKSRDFKELRICVNKLLKIETKSSYCALRAYSILCDDSSNINDLYSALEDINQAIEFNQNEKYYLIKLALLDSLIIGLEHGGDTDQVENEEDNFDDSLDLDFVINYESNILIRSTDPAIKKIGFESYGESSYLSWYKPRASNTLTEEYLKVLSLLIGEKIQDPYYYDRGAIEFVNKLIENYSESILDKALECIRHSIDLEPTAERYLLKMDIEIIGQRWNDALISSLSAYDLDKKYYMQLERKLMINKEAEYHTGTLDTIEEMKEIMHKEGYYREKSLALIGAKRYEEALCLLDQAIMEEPTLHVNPKDSNSNANTFYALKLDTLLLLDEYEKYAELVYELYRQDLPVALTYYLYQLIDIKQSDVLIKVLNSTLHNPIMDFFFACALSNKGQNRESASVFRTINFDQMLEMINEIYYVPYKNSYNGDAVNKEKNIEMMCKALELNNMSDVLYIELLANYYQKEDFDSSPLTSIVKKYLEIRYIRFGKSKQVSLDYTTGENSLTVKLKLLQSLPIDKLEKYPGYVSFMKGIDKELALLKDRDNADRLQESKKEERNRILSNLSHSIKNMLKAVIDPLLNLRNEIPQKSVIIDNAIKGANLIREIVNAINLSFQTTLEELKWDVLNPGCESMTLQDMVVDSLRYSVSNMFDSRYFPAFSEKYFPRSLAKVQYEKIRSNWNEVSAGDVPQIKGFLDKHMFRLELNLDESQDYHVGNDKSSAIKLLILFQEIIFNAVKYTAYVPFPERRVEITLASHGDKMVLAVKNSFDPKVQAKTTGVGKLVIENFASVLGCDPVITEGKDTYSISLEFDNLWQRIAADA